MIVTLTILLYLALTNRVAPLGISYETMTVYIMECTCMLFTFENGVLLMR